MNCFPYEFRLTRVGGQLRCSSCSMLNPATGSKPPRLAWTSAVKIGGLFLLILGAKFWVLRTCSSPLPVFDQWEAEGVHLLAPWLHGKLHLADLFAPWCQHRIVWTRLLVLALFEINGQWDTQVEAIAAALIHAGTAALLAVLLIRRLGRLREDAVLGCLLLLFALPFAHENTLSGGFASQYYTLLLFAVLAIWGLGSHRAGTARWWIGVAGAILAWFSVATGGLAPLAVAAWMGLRLARRDGHLRDSVITLVVALLLGAGGLSLSIGIGQQDSLQPHNLAELLTRFVGLLGWPNPTAFAAPVAWAPFAWLLWRTARGCAPVSRAAALLLPLGGFVILNTAALAYARNRYGDLGVSRYMDFLSFGALVNFCCLLWLLRAARQEAKPCAPDPRLGILTLAWVALAGFGLCRLTSRNLADGLPFAQSCSTREVANVAAFVTHPDLAAFVRKDAFEVMCERQQAAGQLLEDPAILAILPAQVRRPVVLRSTTASADVQAVSRSDDDPAQAGWLLRPGSRAVHFRSQTIGTTRLPYLRFPEVSDMGDDAFVALVAEGSGATTWLQQGPSANVWQPILVKTPPGPFRVEAVVAAGAHRQLSFSFPRESGCLSAWVDTLFDSAIALLFAGSGLWVGAIFWHRMQRPGRGMVYPPPATAGGTRPLSERCLTAG